MKNDTFRGKIIPCFTGKTVRIRKVEDRFEMLVKTVQNFCIYTLVKPPLNCINILMCKGKSLYYKKVHKFRRKYTETQFQKYNKDVKKIEVGFEIFYKTGQY